MEKHEEIEEIKAQIAKLSKKVEELEKWDVNYDFPKEEDEYWHINLFSEVDVDTYFKGNKDSEWKIKSGNCFRTKEEAEAHREKLLVRAELERLSDDGCFEIKLEGGNVKPSRLRTTVKYLGAFYFSTEAKAQNAIDTIGVERLKKFMGIAE